MPEKTVEELLFDEGYSFDFFQAVRVLERLYPERKPVGRGGPPGAEAVRFRAHLSLSFPPSSIYELVRAPDGNPHQMTISFMGLTGPSGILPRHYTELLLSINRFAKHAEKHALRGWFDIFNHRIIAQFFRAWEKYRFPIAFERGEAFRDDPDGFTRALFSLIGLGLPRLRNRLQVAVREIEEEEVRARPVARIDDLALLHYSGLLSHRPRCAVSLRAMLQDFLGIPTEVRQFQGEWLYLDRRDQSRLGDPSSSALAINAVAGERIWDIQGTFRVRLGPLSYAQFCEFMPDRSPERTRKALFLVSHLIRLYVGPELRFQIQLILKKAEVPGCQLGADTGAGAHLGWNTWICSRTPAQDAEDAVLEGEDVAWLA